MIAATCLLLASLGAGYALSKPVTYTAQSRLMVGSFDTRVAAVPGMAVATTTLASTYSRLISTPAVADSATRIADLPRARVAGHISASPIVESPIIVVTGSAASQAEAIRVSNAAAQALVAYVASLNPNTPDALIQRYTDTNNQLLQTQGQLNDLENAAKAHPNDASAAQKADQKRAELNALQLQNDALSQTYSNIANGGNFGLQSIQNATGGGNDRRATFQLNTFLGFFVGLVLSVSFAVYREERRLKKRSPILLNTTAPQHFASQSH